MWYVKSRAHSRKIRNGRPLTSHYRSLRSPGATQEKHFKSKYQIEKAAKHATRNYPHLFTSWRGRLYLYLCIVSSKIIHLWEANILIKNFGNMILNDHKFLATCWKNRLVWFDKRWKMKQRLGKFSTASICWV